MNFNSLFFLPAGVFNKTHQDTESSSKRCLCATAAHGAHKGFWFWLLLKTWPYQDFKLLPVPFLKGLLISVFLNFHLQKNKPSYKATNRSDLHAPVYQHRRGTCQRNNPQPPSHLSSALQCEEVKLSTQHHVFSWIFYRALCFLLNYHVVFWGTDLVFLGWAPYLFQTKPS